MVLAVNVAQTSPAYCRIANSARNFQHYYNDLKQGDNSLNPFERFVFSLVLSNSKSSKQTQQSRELPIGRT